MNKKQHKKNMSLNKKIIVGLITFSMVFFSVLSVTNRASATGLLPTVTFEGFSLPELQTNVLDKMETVVEKTTQKFGSKVLGSVLRNTLNRFAYDAATSLATSNKGQKPVFITEDWGEYVLNLGDAAAGEFIDGLNDWGNMNLCEIDVDIKGRIGLGLVHKVRPTAPQCTFSKMAKEWKNEYEKYQSMTQDDFLRKFSSYFNPSGNEFGIALSLMDGLADKTLKAQRDAELKIGAKGSWLDVRNIAGKLKTIPDAAKGDIENIKKTQLDKVGEYTGDPWIDAANVFLNQFAITLFNNTMKNLISGLDRTSPGDNELNSLFDGLRERFSYEAQGLTSGITSIQNRLKKIIRPYFNERADYDILNELSICPDINNPGPTNCVIDDKLREAIIEHKTVGEAIEDGSLNRDWIFSNSLNYNEAYTYRSMLILRKFRILPIGWEEALLRYYEISKSQEDLTLRTSVKISLMDMVSCFDSNDEYDEFSEDFLEINNGDASWCTGLVDPDWVLKAPLNYCKKEGYGRILDSFFIEGMGEEENRVSSKLEVIRYGEYCADEQSCIQENDDGSCKAFGYCNEEKRTWKFASDSCEPIYNTCKTFQRVGGSTVSFLESTLNYDSGCNANNVGCERYANTGIFQDYGVKWYSSSSIYLNGKVKDCSSNEEGCHEFIRTKDGYGHNFLINSDFEDNLSIGDWDNWGSMGGEGYYSNQSLRLSSDKIKNIAVGPAGYNVSGRTYTLSFYAKNCGLGDVFYIDDTEEDMSTGSNWEYYQLSNTYPEGLLLGSSINIGIDTSSCLIDKIKLEKGKVGTTYSDYRDVGLIYQKLLPQYLESSCYSNTSSGDYTLRDGAPVECSNFVRKCSADEVDCELYTSSKDGFSIPAKISDQDYCFGECIGYDTYIQKETHLNSSKADTFIPSRATICSAEAVGCNAFTNLDDVGRGGEVKEYYSYLRQCIKPNVNSCGDYYTWEGDNETGYQIKAMSLKTVNSEPEVTESDSSECSKDIYNYSPTNPGYNPDCHEFYDKTGDVSYHLLTRTISCDSNCHPYRMAEVNIDLDILQSNCTGSSMNWDSQDNVCNSCKNGGVWSDQHNSCIYQAIPQQGKTCSASQSGCREYNGNTGNNSAIVLTYDFEYADGVSSGWYNENNTVVPLSNDSITRDGKSLYISSQASTVVTDSVREGSSYVLRFLAKTSQSNALLSAFFSNGEDIASFNLIDGQTEQITITGDSEWRIYQVNLSELDHEISFDESLTLVTNNKNISIDDIIVTEIIDKYYVIQGSWNTPDACYYDVAGKYQGPEYNLGCEQYSDRDGDLYSLRQFSELCQDSGVGCELLVDTNNFEGHENDEFTYVVYDNTKQCGPSDLGCQLLGRAGGSTNTNLFTDIYLLNNPNNYNEISCSASAVDCYAWMDGEGSVTYFKDPRDNVCEWRQGADADWKWYEVNVKRCDSNYDGFVSKSDEVCIRDGDCMIGEKCLEDEIEYPCSVNRFKTIGYGGDGSSIYQPDDTTGLCSDVNSGCTEYIDPVSQFSTNVIFNPSYLDLNRDESDGDGWDGDSQEVYLDPYTLYVMSSETNSPFSIINCEGIRELRSNNNFTAELSTISTVDNSFRFLTAGDRSCTVIGGDTDVSISLRKAIINYKLEQDIDRITCSGQVDFSDGCILFNERSYEGNGIASLDYSYNAFISPDNNGGPVSCTSGGDCNSNQIIKVEPDRVCNSWLSCVGYSKNIKTGEEVCHDVGECNQLDPKGNCSNFVIHDQKARSFDPTLDQNITGYSKLGSNSIDRMNGIKDSGSYLVSTMEEVGLDVVGAHFDFEGPTTEPFSPEFTTLINEPDNGEKGIDYPAHGKGFLKLPAKSYDHSYLISIETEGEHYINYLFNTDMLISSVIGVDAKAIVTIETEAGAEIAVFESPVSTGWTRNIGSFEVEVGKIKIKISTNSDIGDAYFDDINIEPVLKINEDEYISKSCRLFPQQNSAVCKSINENIIANGWYGYCLEKDPYNNDSCILWYPVDSVNAGITSLDNDFAYSGKFPVNYCIELDGNFDLVEKRQVTVVMNTSDGLLVNLDDGCASIEKLDLANNNDGTFNNDDLFPGGSVNLLKDSWVISKICGDPGYEPFLEMVDRGGWFNDRIRFYCVPKGILIEDENYIYPFDDKDTKSKEEEKKDGIGGCKGKDWAQGWARYDGDLKYLETSEETINESVWGDVPEISNSVMVYDYADKAIYSLEDDVGSGRYGLRCKKFVNTVKQNAVNRTWTDRVSEGSKFNLSNIGGLNYEYNTLSYYPFGASSLIYNPDAYDYKIEFKMEGNKNDGEFAGLPFGCDTSLITDDYDPCRSIGVCKDSSGDSPGRLCIAYDEADYLVGSGSCGGDQCLDVFNLTNTIGGNYVEVLKHIFLEGYGVYNWEDNGVTRGYNLNESESYDYSNLSSNPIPSPCDDGERDNNEFCAIYPQIKNVSLSFSGVEKWDGTPGETFEISKSGMATLEFNSIIDKEQFPVRKLEIDWGDGDDRDIHLNQNPPLHIFGHHYYTDTSKEYEVSIRVTDNWGFYVKYNCDGSNSERTICKD